MVALQSGKQCGQFKVETLSNLFRKSAASHGLHISGIFSGVGKNQGTQLCEELYLFLTKS